MHRLYNFHMPISWKKCSKVKKFSFVHKKFFFWVGDFEFIVVENKRKAFSIPVSISESNTVIPVIRMISEVNFWTFYDVTNYGVIKFEYLEKIRWTKRSGAARESISWFWKISTLEVLKNRLCPIKPWQISVHRDSPCPSSPSVQEENHHHENLLLKAFQLFIPLILSGLSSPMVLNDLKGPKITDLLECIHRFILIVVK